MSTRRRRTNSRRPHVAVPRAGLLPRFSRRHRPLPAAAARRRPRRVPPARRNGRGPQLQAAHSRTCCSAGPTRDGTVHLFEYQRGSGQGERRLHAKRSVGVGGHISSIDAAAGHLQHVYREGMRRELEEEVVDRHAVHRNDRRPDQRRRNAGRPGPSWASSTSATSSSPNVRPREADILDARFRPSPRSSPRSTSSKAGREIAVRALFS